MSYRRAYLTGGGTGRRTNYSGYWVEWYEPTAAGLRRRRMMFDRREDARAYAQRKTRELNAGRFGDVAWATMIELYAASCESLSDGTSITYTRSLESFGKHANWPSAARITPAVCQAWINSIGGSAATARKHYRHLAAFIRFGMKQAPPWFAYSPLGSVKLPRFVRQLVRAPSIDVAAELLRVAGQQGDALGWYLIIRLAIETGLRIGDLLALEWSAVSRQTVDGKPRTVITVVEKKTRQERVYVLTPAAADAIEARRKLPVIFAWSLWQRKAWDKMRVQAKADDITIHDLRRACATAVGRLATGQLAAAQALGHSATSVTRHHYLDALEQAALRADLLATLPLPTWAEVSSAAPAKP